MYEFTVFTSPNIIKITGYPILNCSNYILFQGLINTSTHKMEMHLFYFFGSIFKVCVNPS